MAFSRSYVQNACGDTGRSIERYVNSFPTDPEGELLSYFTLVLFMEGNNDSCLGTAEFYNPSNDALLDAVNKLFLNIYDEEELDPNHPGFRKHLSSPVLLGLSIGSHIWDDAGKTIFKIDREFANHFTQTEKLRIYPFELLHLPTNSMYIDVSETSFNDKGAALLEGVLVNVFSTADNTIHIIINYCFQDTLELDQLVMIPTRIAIRQEDCIYENGNVYWEFEKLFKNNKVNIRSNDAGNVDYTSIDSVIMLVLNLLCYVSCKKPDIVESKFTKKQKSRYERLNKPYDKVTEYEVGYRYGKAISLYNDRVTKEYEGHKRSKGHNSPRPHLVKAHWHGSY